MYSTFAAFGLLSWLFLPYAGEWPRSRRSWAYALSLLAALYTHYYGVLLVGAQAAAVVLRDGITVRALRSARTQLVAVLALAPWLWLAREVVQSHRGAAVYGASVVEAWAIMSTRALAGYQWEASTGLGVAVAILIAIWTTAEPASRRRRAGLALGMALPLAVVGLGSSIRPLFHERYFIWMVPLIVIGSVGGLHALAQRVAPAAPDAARLLSVVPVLGLALWGLRAQALVPQPTWEELAVFLEGSTAREEAVIVTAPDPSFHRYYRGPATVQLVPAEARPPPDRLRGQVRAALSRHQVNWLVEIQNPGWVEPASVEEILSEAAGKTLAVEVAGFRVSRWQARCPGLWSEGQTVGATFGDAIALAGYRLEHQGSGHALSVELCWTSLGPVEDDYTVFVHLVDGDGRLLSQHDGQPARGSLPTGTWQPGDRVLDEHALELPGEAARPPYRILVGLYRLETGERLPAQGAAGPYPDAAVPIASLPPGG